MKQTTKVLLSAVLTIALCVSVISGATFALFTSEAQTNIAVTAGTVKVEANIPSITLSSMGIPQTGTFANGGTAVYNAQTGELKLDKVTPGDKAVFDIVVTNKSNVDIQYRVVMKATGELAPAIVAKATINGTVHTIDANQATTQWFAVDANADINAIAMSVELPTDKGNEWQGKSANVSIVLEAVQGNGADLYGGTFVGSDEAVKDELIAEKENIHVVLTDDVVYDVAAWANDAMGGTITETITIDGQGHTITFNQTDSDWNNIVTNGAKLIIKNAHITNSGYNDGPWNRHDLNFACDVELINVTSDKALAFKAGATLKNVTINDANTSDTYAIWIQPNGQTVDIDGLTVDMLDCTDGRGIKIDEQYVSSPAKVTLNVKNATFKTEEKSAILVKSAAGADITLANVDISGVVADPVNAVWVDKASESYANLVTVTGGTKAVEESATATVEKITGISGLTTALANNTSVYVELPAGNVVTNLEIPGGKNVTIVGNGKDTVISGQIATTSSTDGTLTIKNATIKVDGITDSTGISQTSKSAIAIWGSQTVICENVTFDMSLADSTAITSWWDTGVGTSIIVRNCTFNCNGQRPIRATGNVTVENCTFNDPYRYAVQLTAKASTAIELDKAIINFNNNTIVNGEHGKAFVYGIQLEGADYGCNNCVINGTGNTIDNGGNDSAMYYCECGKVVHDTIEWNVEVEPVHENP